MSLFRKLDWNGQTRDSLSGDSNCNRVEDRTMPTYIGQAPKRTNLESSPYYWWWRYLKLNAQYVETCQNLGYGACAALYADFGDVRPDGDEAFWSWWGENGECHGRLFQERTLMTKAHLLESQGDWQPIMGKYPYVVIAVDLHMGVRAVERAIAAELPRHFHKPVGRAPMRWRFSTARYKLSDYGSGKLFRDCCITYQRLIPAVDRYGGIEKIPIKEMTLLTQQVHHDLANVETARRRVRQKEHDIRELFDQATEWVDWVGRGSFPGPPLEEFEEWERIFDDLIRTTGERVQYMD